MRQNKSVIASKTNCFFYCPILFSFFFSCPREKLCWRIPWVSDHGEGSANNHHPSPLPAMPLNAAIRRSGQNKSDLSSLSLKLYPVTALHIYTDTPHPALKYFSWWMIECCCWPWVSPSFLLPLYGSALSVSQRTLVYSVSNWIWHLLKAECQV